MTTILKSPRFTFFICLMLLITSLCANAQGPQILLVTGEWAPYSTANRTGYGLVSEIVTSVFVEMGLEAEYEFLPWKRCEAEVLHANAWAAFPYAKNSQREAQFWFTDMVCPSRDKFFVYGDKVKLVDWKTLADLKAFSIGGVMGYYYENDFAKAGLKVDYSTREELALRKLRAGRVDLVPLNEAVGWYLIKEMFPASVNDFRVLPKIHSQAPLHLLVSKTYPDSAALRRRFNQGLKVIKAKGIYADLLRKYNLEN